VGRDVIIPMTRTSFRKKENPEASRKPHFMIEDDDLAENSFKVLPNDQSWF